MPVVTAACSCYKINSWTLVIRPLPLLCFSKHLQVTCVNYFWFKWELNFNYLVDFPHTYVLVLMSIYGDLNRPLFGGDSPSAKGLSRQPLHCHALWQSTSWLLSWVGGWESSCTSFFASSLQNSQFTDSISPIRAWDCIGWPWFILCYLVLIHANLSYALDNNLLKGVI